jgi:rubrerythrin
MIRGELEARALEAERAQANSPPDVSRQLRRIAQAEADAWRQHADAATRHDHTQAAHARALSGRLAAERQRLEAASTRYEKWSVATAVTRETAARARAELERRGISRQPVGPPQPQVVKQPEADDADPSGGREDETPVTPAASQEGPQRQADRLEELLARSAAAVRRIAAHHKGARGRAQYAARIGRETQALLEPARQTQAQPEAEM